MHMHILTTQASYQELFDGLSPSLKGDVNYCLSSTLLGSVWCVACTCIHMPLLDLAWIRLVRCLHMHPHACLSSTLLGSVWCVVKNPATVARRPACVHAYACMCVCVHMRIHAGVPAQRGQGRAARTYAHAHAHVHVCTHAGTCAVRTGRCSSHLRSASSMQPSPSRRR